MSYTATLFRFADHANVDSPGFGLEDDEMYACYDFDKDYDYLIKILEINPDNIPVKMLEYYTGEFLDYSFPRDDQTKWENTPIYEFDNVDLSFVEKQFKGRSRIQRVHHVIALEEIYDIGPARWFEFNGKESAKYGDFGCSFAAKDALGHISSIVDNNILTKSFDIDILQSTMKGQKLIIMAT